LILQEGPDVPGRLPDDSEFGGFIDFFFATPTDIGSIRVLDTETQAVINTWDANGNKVKSKAPAAGDCGISSFDVMQRGVTQMTVKIRESGAVSAFSYCVDP